MTHSLCREFGYVNSEDLRFASRYAPSRPPGAPLTILLGMNTLREMFCGDQATEADPLSVGCVITNKPQ